MIWEAWATIGVLVLVITLFAITSIAPDVIMMGGVTILVVMGILSPAQAFNGFANEGVVTVALLFVVAAGLKETGGIAIITQRLLGRPRTIAGAQARLAIPVAAASAFINNTPLVAMLIPAVSEWTKNLRFPSSKFLLPLSYAAILGGVCSLIGTSTNIVVNGLLIHDAGKPGMHMFDIAWVGVPCCVAGIAYLLVASRCLLPDRRPAFSQQDDPREYIVEMLVEPGSALVGKTIEDAGLRHLQGVFLVEIEREGQIIAAVRPQERLSAGDRLMFAGVVDSVVDLQRFRGLRPATDQVFKLDSPRNQRILVEAVVSNTCPITGMTIRDGRFRTTYNAAVIAVSRNGERIRKKIGDIVLRVGDTLLVEAHPSFLDQQRNSKDFFLVSSVEGYQPLRHDRAWFGVGILVVFVVTITANWLDTLTASLLAAGLMIAARCCTTAAARRSVDWSVLIAIGASFGLGKAMETSGAAAFLADRVISLGSGSPWFALVVMYGIAMVMTELMSNNAAAVLTFPIAMSVSATLGVSYMPFVMAIMIAASCGFATPIGYQTHLMVYGPGGYRFMDFVRIGVPLDILMWIVTVLVTPLVWKF